MGRSRRNANTALSSSEAGGARLWVRRLARSLKSVLKWLSPLRRVRALRMSLTPASVTLILIGIISLNIVWGYPWLGMFAACVACLVVGRAVNFFASPRLVAIANAAQTVPVDCDLAVPVRLVNQHAWPAMDLVFEQTHRCRYVAAHGEVSITPTVRFSQRGQHPLPRIQVDSYFPFYLFRDRQWVDAGTTIVVTPRRLVRERDADWQELELTLKGLASQVAQGDQIHYIGSREYREGVPVRRWDFSSWARLGKPILREFSTPAAKSVRVVIDTVRPESARPQNRADKTARLRRWIRKWKPIDHAQVALDAVDIEFERALSLAASAIETLVQNGAAVVLEMRMTADSDDRHPTQRCEAGGDPVELLIVLGNAQAQYIDDELYQARKPPSETSSRERHEATIVIESGRDAQVEVGRAAY